MAFAENDGWIRTRHAAQNLGIIRRLVLSLPKQAISQSVGTAIKQNEADWNPDYLPKVPTAEN